MDAESQMISHRSRNGACRFKDEAIDTEMKKNTEVQGAELFCK